MSKSAKQAPKLATVNMTVAGKTWTASGKDRNEALVNLSRLIEAEG